MRVPLKHKPRHPQRLEESLVADAESPDPWLVDLHIRLLRGILGRRNITCGAAAQARRLSRGGGDSRRAFFTGP